MPRKKQEVARSQLMAQAERLAEIGVAKAAIVFFDNDGDMGMCFAGGISNMELVFAFEQAKMAASMKTTRTMTKKSKRSLIR